MSVAGPEFDAGEVQRARDHILEQQQIDAKRMAMAQLLIAPPVNAVNLYWQWQALSRTDPPLPSVQGP